MGDTQISVRLPQEQVRAIDAWVEQMRRDNPGIKISRSDYVRSAVASMREKSTDE